MEKIMENKNAKYQREFRKRNAELGRKEVRGIIATDGEKAVIKNIRKMLANLRKKDE